MDRLLWFLKFIKKNEKGNVLFIVAAALILLMGMTALVIDVGQLYVVRRQMVNAADAAALAGALEAKNNEKSAREAAATYADFNGAENFDLNINYNFGHPDIYFSGDGEFRTISVRTAKEVNYTFARVLGFESSIVQAVASAQVGPGNPLTPFVDLGWECDECCQCAKECICNSEPCECADECQCGVDPDCEKCGGLGYFIRTSEDEDDPMGYKSAEFGDNFEIKGERWQDWLGFESGDFPWLELPGQTGASGLRENIAGGYTGELTDVRIGEVLRAQTGSIASARDGVLTRMTIHQEPYCTFNEDGDYIIVNGCNGWYKCELVVVIPIVIHHYDNKYFEIVGYASVLIDANKYEGEKYIWVYFLEYLTYERLRDEVLPEYLEGFVTRLVQDPKEALTYFSSSPVQLASQ